MIGFIAGALTQTGTSFGMDSEWAEIKIFDDGDAAKETRRLWDYQRVPDKSFRDNVLSFLESGEWDRFPLGHIAIWDVRDVSDMAEAFSNLRATEPLDLSFWDTRGVTSMRKMFSEFQGNAQVETWDTRNVIDMSHMFQNATQFNADLSGWKTGQEIRPGYRRMEDGQRNRYDANALWSKSAQQEAKMGHSVRAAA